LKSLRQRNFSMTSIKSLLVTVSILMVGYSLAFVTDTSQVIIDSINPKTETTGIALPGQPGNIAAEDSSWFVREVENRAFGVGEYLEFGINYGMISAGWATMSIPEMIDCGPKKCYRIISIAHSNDFVSMFYPIRDTVESQIDSQGIFTRYFRKHLREGNYRTDKITNFDQRQHLAITGKDTIATYSFVQDVLSSLYYIRTQTIEPGKEIYIDNHTDKKNYPLRVIVYGREKVEVPAGKFNCLVVEPVMRYEGIFKAKGKIKIWLTDDQYKIPVKMQSEVNLLGSISAKLKKYTYGEIKKAD
jgi:hypothetical protein